MDSGKRKQLSKFLSYVLRHHPEAIGLNIGKHGWAEVSELIEKAKKDDRELDRNSILEIIKQSQKKRFILSEDENYIRAGYGHSIDVDLQLRAKEPPEILYHGTAKRNISSILDEGIRPGSRNFVHLSAAQDEAKNVGSRHGSPAILKIMARQMNEAGYDFFQSDSEPGIWLVSFVPVEFIEVDS